MKTLWPGKWKIDKGIEKEKWEREREREREMDFGTRMKFQLGPLLPWDDEMKSGNDVEKKRN